VNRVLVIGLIGVAAIILAVALLFWRDASVDESLKQAAQAPTTASELEPGQSEVKSVEGTGTDGKSESPLEDTKVSPESALPSFDIVRINPQGDAVIAGRAAPGATVTVLDGEAVVGTVVSDEKGEWVLVPEKPLPPGERALSVIAKVGDGEPIRSDELVILSVPERVAPEQRPLAVLVPREGMDTKKVLQTPTGTMSGRGVALALKVVDYDEEGNLHLSGVANPGNATLVYLDNAPIGRAEVQDTGEWALRPDAKVEPGIYTLRVDEVAKTKVVARIELPFSRAAPVKTLTTETYIVVQPGNSLWRISRQVLGKGIMYSTIYEANKEQIRDADLIYPGQVFTVPKIN